ncbi:MAG: methyltransferase domain-containing protein [Coriobacteriia bacterium]|nr:methyltransferase domain-containing protein [Coriobacteriia bacterium]
MADGTPCAPYTPLLTTTDWNAEWMELQKARRAADEAAYWNKKSATFGTKDAPSNYVLAFLDQLDLQPGETVFDMGCGNGALAIPLAEAGHKVFGYDFSEGMLRHLEDARQRKGLTNLIETTLMSWEDNWDHFGITENCADVAIASRSIATSNLKDSLLRLNRVARRKVCISLTTGASPRADERVLAALGLQNHIGRDYLYAFNILAQEDLRPSVNYISNAKEDAFDTYEEARESLGRMVRDVTTNLPEDQQIAALQRLDAWLPSDLESFQQDGRTRVRLSEPRKLTWACISWDAR